VTSDDVRRWAEEAEDHPHHPNAWGAIFRGNDWTSLGLSSSEVASNHARRIFIWKYEPKEASSA